MNVTFKGEAVKLVGKQVNVGEDAPIVRLKGNDLGSVIIGGKKDKIQVINVVPSLDTPVCAKQTRIFNEKLSENNNVDVFVVSMDLPFAQTRFCSVEGIKNVKAVSDFNYRELGEKYGVLIGDSPLEGLLTRAVFVVDLNGKIVYKEICSEITNEPDYNKAIEAVKNNKWVY